MTVRYLMDKRGFRCGCSMYVDDDKNRLGLCPPWCVCTEIVVHDQSYDSHRIAFGGPLGDFTWMWTTTLLVGD